MSEEREHRLSYSIYEEVRALDPEEQGLWQKAKEALHNSYSPYSDFAVGAALLLEDGSIVTGANQENAAFPSSICAERVAVWKAATNDPSKKLRTLALTAARTPYPVSPCGSCRQVLSEFEERSGNPLRLLFPAGNGKVIAVDRVRDLLPFPFDTASLRKDGDGS